MPASYHKVFQVTSCVNAGSYVWVHYKRFKLMYAAVIAFWLCNICYTLSNDAMITSDITLAMTKIKCSWYRATCFVHRFRLSQINMLDCRLKNLDNLGFFWFHFRDKFDISYTIGENVFFFKLLYQWSSWHDQFHQSHQSSGY